MQLDFTDDVRGVVVGGDGIRVEYWSRDGRTFIDRQFFTPGATLDDEAEAWIRDNHPAWYAVGVDIRVFDQPRAQQ